jgi:hypothetical protein
MTETEIESSLEEIEALINSYDMDLDGWSASALINQWSEQYQPDWLKLAVIEALYQGRYKAFSVQQILNLWQRRGSPIYHFTYEFERLICRNIPTFGANTATEIPEVVNITDAGTAPDLLQTFDPINTTEELTDHETNMIVATLESANSTVTTSSPTNNSKKSTTHPVTHQQLVVNKELFYNKLRAIAHSKELSQELELTAELPDELSDQLSEAVTTIQAPDNLPLVSGGKEDSFPSS